MTNHRQTAEAIVRQTGPDYTPPSKEPWLQPELEDLLTPEEARRMSALNEGEQEPMPEEDMTTEHFGQDAMVDIPVSPLQFIQESVVKGLLDTLDTEHQTRAACFQMALTLKPDGDVDDLLTIAHWLWMGAGQYNTDYPENVES